MNMLIIRTLLYSTVTVFIGASWFSFEAVPGNGGKKGLRLLLAPLFLTWLSISMAGWLKFSGIGSGISVIPFVIAAFVVVFCLLWLANLVIRKKTYASHY